MFEFAGVLSIETADSRGGGAFRIETAVNTFPNRRPRAGLVCGLGTCSHFVF